MKSTRITFGLDWPALCRNFGFVIALFGLAYQPLTGHGQETSAQPAPPAQPAPGATEQPAPAPAEGQPAAQPPAAGQAVPTPVDPPNAAVQKIEEERRAKAAAKQMEEEKPTKNKPRKDYIDKPGAPRERLPNYFQAEPLQYEPLTKREDDMIQQMRRESAPVDINLIDKYAKAQVYSLTDPGDEANMSRKVENILKTIRDAKTAQNQPNLQFRRALKSSLIKFTKDLLENSLVVRINALVLLEYLFDDVADVPDAVPVLMEILEKPDQGDPVYFRTLMALEKAKNARQMQVIQEKQVASSVLKLAQREEVQGLFQEEAARTLGTMGHGFDGDIPERAEVATLLAKWALDPDKSLRLRYEASQALAKIDDSRIQNWNHELQATIIAIVLRDSISAYMNSNPELNDLEVLRWRTWNLFESLKKIAGKQGNQSNPKFQALASISGLIGKIVVQRSPTDTSDLESLTKWIDGQQGIENKLAPLAQPLDALKQAGPTKPNPPL